MGAWDYGVFDDDSSLDLISELQDCTDIDQYCESVFDNAIHSEYLDYDEGIAVSVCGALIDSILYGTTYATCFDTKSDIEGKEQYLNWIKRVKSSISPDYTLLKDKAIKALTVLISEESELCELWSEDEDLFAKWTGIYHDMISRLDK